MEKSNERVSNKEKQYYRMDKLNRAFQIKRLENSQIIGFFEDELMLIETPSNRTFHSQSQQIFKRYI